MEKVRFGVVGVGNMGSQHARSLHSGLVKNATLAAICDIDQKKLENFKKEFMAAGNAIFGSGWVWLAKTPEGKLLIQQEGNAGNPLTKGYIPLLGIDVWEHSYYLDYQNRRADHLEALWSIIDWKTIEARY